MFVSYRDFLKVESNDQSMFDRWERCWKKITYSRFAHSHRYPIVISMAPIASRLGKQMTPNA